MNDHGIALCCNQLPELGQHNYHQWNGQTLPGWGFYCKHCHKSASVLASNLNSLETRAFAAENWNRKFHTETNLEPAISGPAGWRWGQLSVEWSWMGGKFSVRFPHILFWTANPYLTRSKCGYECYIDESRHHRDLKLMNLDGHEEDLWWLNKHKRMSAHAHTGTTWCTDKTRWYHVYISIMSDKWAYSFNSQLKALTGIDLVDRRNNPSNNY